METSYRSRALAAILAIGLLGSASEATSAALAKKTGGSGYSGTLFGTKAQRKQQLICDPNEPVAGSTSTTYDPSIVTLSGFEFGPGYFGNAFVEVIDTRVASLSAARRVKGGEVFNPTVLQSIPSFLDSPFGPETGYLQVNYTLDGTAGKIAGADGFKLCKDVGVAGVDTHAFTFDYLSEVPDTTVATYKVYADSGRRASNNSPDFLTGVDPTSQREFTLGPDSLSSATVSCSLVMAPLPSAFAAGLTMLAGLGAAAVIRERACRA